MATMKYIGARYMPKFMGTYDATTAYEALSVVDNGAGTTYVANKPAPAGTPLSDTEYWSIYGASSGAILDLQGRMTTAENDIDNLENDITTVENAIPTAVAAVDPLEKFRNKTICVIGDSISDYEVLAENWVKKLERKLSNYNCTVINSSDAGRSFASLRNDIIGGLVTIPVADYYILFIGLNYSDTWGFTTGTDPMVPAINYVNSAIKAANPSAHYIFISPMKTYVSIMANRNTPLCVIRSFLESYFAHQGYTILSGYNMPEMSIDSYTDYTIDGLHPNELYANIMYDYILNGITSERSNISVPQFTTRTLNNTPTTNSRVIFFYHNTMEFEIDITAFSYTPTPNQWVDVCEVPTLFDSIIYPMWYAVFPGNLSDIQFRISNNHLQIYTFSAITVPTLNANLKFRYEYNVND